MQNSLEAFLDSPDGAGNVLAHARRLIALSRIYQKIVPAHLGQASHLANYKSGIVVIHAVNGAVATKLRQLAPTLTQGFSTRGVECSGVLVKVQAEETGRQSTTSTQKPLSPRTCGELAELRDGLPESALRTALDGLLRRSARGE